MALKLYKVTIENTIDTEKKDFYIKAEDRNDAISSINIDNVINIGITELCLLDEIIASDNCIALNGK